MIPLTRSIKFTNTEYRVVTARELKGGRGGEEWEVSVQWTPSFTFAR
jgi:hypothetical protein